MSSRLPGWSFVLRLFRRSFTEHELTPLMDDSTRRLLRRGETPQRLEMHGDTDLRALHGRDPPAFTSRRKR